VKCCINVSIERARQSQGRLRHLGAYGRLPPWAASAADIKVYSMPAIGRKNLHASAHVGRL
jgi:hypothetical protein